MKTQTYTIWNECKITPQAIRRGIFFALSQILSAAFKTQFLHRKMQGILRKGSNPEFVAGFVYTQ